MRSMGAKWALLMLPCLGTGCLLEKQGARLPMAISDEAQFKQECEQVRRIGDVSRLGYQVDSDAREILNLSSGPDPQAAESTIRGLVGDITSAVTSLKSLTAPAWNTEKWRTQLSWEFGPSDLVLLGSECDLSEKHFLGSEVTNVFWDGAEHSELVSQVGAETSEQSAHFDLTLSESTLSLCELLNVTGIQVRLNFMACGQADYRDYALKLDNPQLGD